MDKVHTSATFPCSDSILYRGSPPFYIALILLLWLRPGVDPYLNKHLKSFLAKHLHSYKSLSYLCGPLKKGG